MYKPMTMSRALSEWKSRTPFVRNSLDWTSIEESLNVMGFAHVPRMVGRRPANNLLTSMMTLNPFEDVLSWNGTISVSANIRIFLNRFLHLVEEARSQLYTHLAPVANRMMHAMHLERSISGHAR